MHEGVGQVLAGVQGGPESLAIMSPMLASPGLGMLKYSSNLLPWLICPEKTGARPKLSLSQSTWAWWISWRKRSWVMGGACSASWGLLAVGCHRSREWCRALTRWIHSQTRRPSDTGSSRARRLKLRSHLMVVFPLAEVLGVLDVGVVLCVVDPLVDDLLRCDAGGEDGVSVEDAGSEPQHQIRVGVQ